MTRAASSDTITIKKRELKAMLRQVVREVVRDELSKFATTPEEDWDIEEGSVLWQDLIELKKEIREGKIQLLTHEQVFGK